MVQLVGSAVTGNVATKADVELIRKYMENQRLFLEGRIDSLDYLLPTTI